MKENVRVYDYNNEILDRYTIILGDEMYGCSENPFHPQGFGQYVGKVQKLKSYKFLGKKVKIEELPDKVKKYISQLTGNNYNE